MNDATSPPDSSPKAPQDKVHLLHSLRAHSGLAWAVFWLVFAPGFVVAWTRGQPQYVTEAAIQVAPNFMTTLQAPDELRDSANRYQDFLRQQVLNITRYEVLARSLDQLGPNRDFWQFPDETDAQAIARLQALLEVVAVNGSFRISVTLAGRHKEGLAEIVNAVVDSYLATQRSDTLFAGDDRVKELEKYRVELVTEMNKALEEKSRIAQELGVTSFDRTVTSPMQSQLADTSKALGEARRSQITSQAKLDALDASAGMMLDLELISQARLSIEQDVVRNDASAPLLARRGALQASLAGLTSDNPAARVAQSELEDIDAVLAKGKEAAVLKLADTLAQRRKTQTAQDRLLAVGDVEKARSLVTSLEAELTRLQTHLGSSNSGFEQGRNLEAEIERSRRKIESIDDRADMFKLEATSPGFARLDSPARTPEKPTRGGRLKYILVFVILAAGLAVGSTVVADVLDQQIHRARDLERAFGFPPLGWIREPVNAEAARQAEDQVRRLALGLEREAKRKGTRRFVITSVKPHARTAGLVRDLARELTATGVKVLTVSANVQDAGASASSRGLVDVLEDDVDPDAVIVAGSPSVLPLGAGSGLSRLPAAHRLGPVLDRAGRGFDIVLVHAPPLMDASDAELLVSLSDATLLVVVAEDEELGEVRAAVRLLERLSPPVVGMVLTGVRDANGTSDSVT